MHLLGIDIGFGFTKATNGGEVVVFKSIFGDAADIQYWADFSDRRSTEQLHVTIDGKSYFIGEMAEQQSRQAHYTLDQERLITDYVRILAVTAAGLLIPNGTHVNVPVNVVSGLPIGHFRRHHERFQALLTGHHAVTYHAPGGEAVTREVYINKVRMLPQPLGSALNLVLDDGGRIADRELAGQKIGLVDIGFRTTDFTILDRLRHIDRGCRTLDLGMAKAFGLIAQRLQERCGVAVELYRLYRAVAEGSIRMRGKPIDIRPIRDPVFAQLAAAIAGEIERLWADDWDIDLIVFSGGGARELAHHLQPMIEGRVAPFDPHSDPRLNNVCGYLKYGRFVWGEAAARRTAEVRALPARRREPEEAAEAAAG